MHRLVWNNKNENAYVENTELVHSVRCWNELEKRAHLCVRMSAKKILRSKSPKEAVRPKKNEKMGANIAVKEVQSTPAQ